MRPILSHNNNQIDEWKKSEVTSKLILPLALEIAFGNDYDQSKVHDEPKRERESSLKWLYVPIYALPCGACQQIC